MKTPITYYGGKQTIASYVVSLIPSHKIYVEPFFGGGAVFFAKNYPQYSNDYIEVINDKDERVVNFYRVCRDYELFKQLQHKVKYTLHCRETYKEAKEKLNSENEVEKAWAFWVQTNMSFCSSVGDGFAFNKTKTSKAAIVANKVARFTEKIHDRLKKVTIEKDDAIKVIERWDSKNTFFYIDPPYFNADMGHYGGYTETDFKNLLDTLKNVQGKFLLSSYDSELLRSYNFNRIAKKMFLAASNNNSKKKKVEILSYNYEIHQNLFICNTIM